jgi:hypothetical protein
MTLVQFEEDVICCPTHCPGRLSLVTDEPVEFEKQPDEVRDFMRITNHFRGIYSRIFPLCTKECQHVIGWI